MRKNLTTNIPLKLAIITSHRKQRDISLQTRIAEVRLSHIVCGRVEPTAKERKVIAKALQRHEDELFPAFASSDADPTEPEAVSA